MELDDLPASGRLVEPIDVLGDQQKVGNASFQLGQREMPWVG